MSTIPMRFDDTRLNYNGIWEIGGTASEYLSTTHGTNENGASASFLFFGTSISVYGTIAANAKRAISIYTVDSSNAVTFTAHPTKTVQYQQLFYKVSDLASGWHKLVITCATENAQFWLDYVVVINERVPTTSSTLTSNTQPTESPSEALTILSTSISILASSSSKSSVFLPSVTVNSFTDIPTIIPTPSTPTLIPTSSKPAKPSIIIVTNNSTPLTYQATTNIPSSSIVSLVLPSPSASSEDYAPPSSNSASSGNHAGAIAGGVIATLVCIALAAVVFLWFRRRREMRAPSRLAPKTPDPNWFTRHSFQWPNEKPQTDIPL